MFMWFLWLWIHADGERAFFTTSSGVTASRTALIPLRCKLLYMDIAIFWSRHIWCAHSKSFSCFKHSLVNLTTSLSLCLAINLANLERTLFMWYGLQFLKFKWWSIQAFCWGEAIFKFIWMIVILDRTPKLNYLQCVRVCEIIEVLICCSRYCYFQFLSCWIHREKIHADPIHNAGHTGKYCKQTSNKKMKPMKLKA